MRPAGKPAREHGKHEGICTHARIPYASTAVVVSSGQQLKKKMFFCKSCCKFSSNCCRLARNHCCESSAQAGQRCRLARNHCCGRQHKPGKGDEDEDVVLLMANASPVPFDIVTLYESCGISAKHLAGWSTSM
jgi:hypothetical protein